ncbi:MAG: methyltransferase domain-containing protein [Acidobacteria bacterium]|nr:methyltransferase domain-containing protein [Acidobacteriota bacterium]MCL5288759.1 methyltransferase domain-containing protein [Acidobacteriota bacterium]
MNFKGFEICCPHCRGELEFSTEEQLACRGCARKFPIVAGIPDLRIFPGSPLSIEEDTARARQLAEKFDTLNFEGMVDYYFRLSTVVPPHHRAAYKRGLQAAVPRTRAWLKSWEAAAGNSPARSLLEVGCGAAGLLVAAENYPLRAGVDIALRWLVVGKRQLADAGMDVPLLCACAEALPFRDEQFDRVVSDSTLEMVRDQRRMLEEARRVLTPGGKIFVATPNRFSLGPDPHTGIPAGSWLPKKWTDAIVVRQGALPPVRRLLSRGALERALREAGFADVRTYLPEFPKEQSALFSAGMRAVVGIYHSCLRLPVARQLLTMVGPMFHAVAMKKLNG